MNREGVYKLLEDEVGLSKNEADGYFALTSEKGEFTLKLRGGAWLEATTLKAMRNMVEKAGGSFTSNTFTIPAGFEPVAADKPTREEVKDEAPYSPGKSMLGEGQFLMIPVSEVVRSPFSIREGTDLTEITKSIEENGVIEPVIVRKDANGRYELVAGERRFSASKAAGLKEIPAVVRTLSDEQAFTIQSCENLHRADLSDSEKTALVTFYAERFQKKPKEIAKQLGMSHDWVLKYLPDRFKDQVKAEAGRVGGLATQEKVLDVVNQTVKTHDTSKEEYKKLQNALDEAIYPNCPVCLDEPDRIVGDLPHVKCPNGHEWNLKTGDLMGDSVGIFPETYGKEGGGMDEVEAVAEKPTHEELKPTPPVDYKSANKSCPICLGPVSPEKYERLKRKYGGKYPNLFTEEAA